VVSYATKPKLESELTGLVYGCTEMPSEEDLPLFKKPLFWAVLVALALVAVNIIFW
jgi:SSS family solute:Na+ symporter